VQIVAVTTAPLAAPTVEHDSYVEACRRLSGRFPDPAMRAQIAQIVADEYAAFADARITTFVPILVERRAVVRLRDQASVVRPP
jgi:hypothetical protein